MRQQARCESASFEGGDVHPTGRFLVRMRTALSLAASSLAHPTGAERFIQLNGPLVVFFFFAFAGRRAIQRRWEPIQLVLAGERVEEASKTDTRGRPYSAGVCSIAFGVVVGVVAPASDGNVMVDVMSDLQCCRTSSRLSASASY